MLEIFSVNLIISGEFCGMVSLLFDIFLCPVNIYIIGINFVLLLYFLSIYLFILSCLLIQTGAYIQHMVWSGHFTVVGVGSPSFKAVLN